MKSWLIEKVPDAKKGRRQEEKGITEKEMVGWHHWLNGYEFEQALGDGEGQGRLACCSPWGRKGSDMTEWLSNNMNMYVCVCVLGFPSDTHGKKPSCQCRRYGRLRLGPWVGKIPWRSARQPTPGFLPGEFHGQRSLVDRSPWSCKELDTTEQLTRTLNCLEVYSISSLTQLWFRESWDCLSSLDF